MKTISSLVAILGVGLCLHACGGGTDGGAGRFMGTWRAVSGTSTWTCPGFAPAASPVTSNVTWSEGISSDLVQAFPDTSCVINADVVGSTASGTGSACTVVDASGGTITLTVTSYTFVVAGDGQTAQENLSATGVLNSDGASVTCAVSETASYQKLSK